LKLEKKTVQNFRVLPFHHVHFSAVVYVKMRLQSFQFQKFFEGDTPVHSLLLRGAGDPIPNLPNTACERVPAVCPDVETSIYAIELSSSTGQCRHF